ncbi:MAG: hypothetical protein HYY06_31655 [Deltaproteobacteria bacterium]|nr:hypothetical protein [Deltaproteobacteria bacterium]
MRSALLAVEGVRQVEVDFQSKSARVVASPAVSEASLCDAVRAAGYGCAVGPGP